MKLFFLFILSFMTASAVHAQSVFPLVAHSKADALNVRAGQNANFEVIAKLNKGEQIVVEEEQYGWYRIRLPKHAQAFMSAKYVSALQDDIAEVTGSRVNVRSGPNERYSVLGQVRAEDKVKVLEHKKDWVRIEPWPNMAGWVSAKYIELTSVTAADAMVPSYEIVEEKPVEVVTAVAPEPTDGSFVEEIGRIKTADVNVCADKLTHQLMRKGNIVVYLQGPASIFDSFGVAEVRVKGTVVRQPDEDCAHPVLSVTSVNLVL